MSKDSSEIGDISGLKWDFRWRINNGHKDSFVIPYPTLHPISVIYHGETEFKYGQYGVHLGQQDSLTFFGSKDQLIKAKFIDARENSPTFRRYWELEFSPASDRTLVIPPGIAHTFENLEGVYTINDYSIFLPSAEKLIKKDLPWHPGNDIVNLPEDIDPAQCPGFVPMEYEASDYVYQKISDRQNETLVRASHLHPETRTFNLADGTSATVLLREKNIENESDALPTSEIPGVRFSVLPRIMTGPKSEIVAVNGQRPFYVVEHGAGRYDFD